jgi:hypothetical protein
MRASFMSSIRISTIESPRYVLLLSKGYWHFAPQLSVVMDIRSG